MLTVYDFFFTDRNFCKLKRKVLIELKLNVYRTSIFFVNYSKNHRIFLGGSMGKMIGRGIPNILLFILYQSLAIMEAVEI